MTDAERLQRYGVTMADSITLNRGELADMLGAVCAAEREACAKMCEELFVARGYNPSLRHGAMRCAAAIRAGAARPAEPLREGRE